MSEIIDTLKNMKPHEFVVLLCFSLGVPLFISSGHWFASLYSLLACLWVVIASGYRQISYFYRKLYEMEKNK